LFGARKKIPIGVQLDSVRKNAHADMAATLAGVKIIGYEAVEFAGYFKFDNDAKELRKLLDDNGLKVCGTHIQLAALHGDVLAKTLEFNPVIGNRHQIAARLTPLKMNLGYHNHATQFVAFEGQIPWDIFVGKTNRAALVGEGDLKWPESKKRATPPRS
jgi:hypothetical protein